MLGNVIEAPTHVQRVPRQEAEKEAYQLLESVGLKEKARRYPNRSVVSSSAAIARARYAPGALMFDELTSALDPRRSAGLRLL